MENLIFTIKDDIDVINDYKNNINKQLVEKNIDYKLNTIDSTEIIDKVKQCKFTKEQIQVIYNLISNSAYSAELRTAKTEGFYDEMITEEVDMIYEEMI